MAERTKEYLFGILAWIIIDTICVIVNFNLFLSGDSFGTPPWINLTVSVLFVIYMAFYAFHTTIKIAFSLGGIYVVLGIIGYIVGKYSLIADWILVPALFFGTPFAGLSYLIRSDLFCWLFVIGVGALLLTAAAFRYRKDN